MSRVWKSQTATTVLGVVKGKPKNFDLNIENQVVAAVTDGALIMKKLGRLVPFDHVICLSHPLHLVASTQRRAVVAAEEPLKSKWQFDRSGRPYISGSDDVDNGDKENSAAILEQETAGFPYLFIFSIFNRANHEKNETLLLTSSIVVLS